MRLTKNIFRNRLKEKDNPSGENVLIEDKMGKYYYD
jgi:hypothetical protein